jgi:tRNA(Ile)-lysidine synthase
LLDSKNFYPFLRACTLKKKEDVKSHHQATYVVSLSGGLDSVVLLHLMNSLRLALLIPANSLCAIYVNHNLSASSQEWGDFCQSICDKYQIPLQILSVNAQAKKRQSPEDAARNARYNALKKVLKANDYLLTAHHQTDQAETILLQLFRGSGPQGLSAMPITKDFGHSHLARPLLNFTQQQIKTYAIKHQLQWVEDESNQQQSFKRNFLRLSIFPKLEQQWPSLSKTLFRAGQIQAETTAILKDVAQGDLALCELPIKAEQQNNQWFFQPMLSLTQLKTLSTARIKNCLQFWLRKNNTAVLRSSLLEEFIKTFIEKQPTSKIQITWNAKHLSTDETVAEKNQQFCVRYFQDKVFLCQYQDYNIEVVSQLAENIQLRYRCGGESFKKTENASHYRLKKWFQENAIPPWLRDKVPLFYFKDELFQIGDRLVNQDLIKMTKAICFVVKPTKTG